MPPILDRCVPAGTGTGPAARPSGRALGASPGSIRILAVSSGLVQGFQKLSERVRNPIFRSSAQFIGSFPAPLRKNQRLSSALKWKSPLSPHLPSTALPRIGPTLQSVFGKFETADGLAATEQDVLSPVGIANSLNFQKDFHIF